MKKIILAAILSFSILLSACQNVTNKNSAPENNTAQKASAASEIRLKVK